MECRVEYRNGNDDLGNLTKGSMLSNIWNLSWPLVLTMMTCCILDIAHVHFAGRMDSTAQAAVGLSDQIILVVMILGSSVGTGTSAIISQYWGQGDRAKTVSATVQSIRLAVALGIVLAAIVLVLSKIEPSVFSRSATVIKEGQTYLGIVALQVIPFILSSTINSSCRAIGDSRTQLQVMCTMAAVDLLCNYLLGTCGWPIAGLGTDGIALSSLLGATLSSALAIYKLSQSELRTSLTELRPFSFATMAHILKIGLPSALQELAWVTSTFVLFLILSLGQSPAEAIASWSIGVRIEAFTFLPLSALALALAVIVGQNIGANQVRQAWLAGWSVAAIGVGLMVIGGIILFVFAEPLARAVSHSSRAIEYTTSYLKINAIGGPFLALEIVLSGALQGAGRTRFPMLVCICCHWLLRLPLAFFLTVGCGWGPTGAWTAMVVSNVASGSLLCTRFYFGLENLAAKLAAKLLLIMQALGEQNLQARDTFKQAWIFD